MIHHKSTFCIAKCSLLKKLLSKFIKPVIIPSDKESLCKIAFTDPENQLDHSKLFTGLVTKSLIGMFKLVNFDLSAAVVNSLYRKTPLVLAGENLCEHLFQIR